MSSINKIAIIGAGHAGIQVAASLRENGFIKKITIFDKDSNLPYQKPPLSKGFLKTECESSLLRSEEWYKKNNIDLKLNTPIDEIKKDKKVIIDENQIQHNYDKLIIATGAINRNLDVFKSPNNYDNYITLRNLHESRSLRSLLKINNHIVIIGGGFIGLEVASVAISLGKKVTILESSNYLMGRSISKELSNWFIDYYKNLGIEFHFNEKIASFNFLQKKISSISLTNGVTINSDLYLVAIGSYPNTKLYDKLNNTDSSKNGIYVNEYLQTKNQDIYVIGDCCNFLNFYNKIPNRLESIQNATDQGKFVAKHLMGDKKKYSSIPWFWSDQYKVKLQIVGELNKNENYEIRIVGSVENCQFSFFIFQKNKLQIIESINRPGHHLITKNNFSLWKSVKKEMINKNTNIKQLFSDLSI